MSTADLKSLPSSTARLIGSSQVITSVYSATKELLENSLDANSTSVEIKLENYGLDRIEVRDNGSGIKTCSIPLVAKRYHTSKITSFLDLERLMTYGFRGEALGSLCAVSSLSITSKVSDEEVSQCVIFDHHGNVTSTVPSHLGQGTTVCATHLFKNMPVRRQFYNTAKKKKEELKKIEDLLMWYGAIKPNIRLSLKHGKEMVWQKNVVPDVRGALFGVFGRNVVSQLEHKKLKCEDPEMSLEAYFPSSDSDVHVTSKSTADRCFIAVNNRAVFHKSIDKIVRHHYCHHHHCEGRYPIYFLAIDCPSSEVDVNLDPNKTKVMLHHQKDIIEKLTEILEELYGPVSNIGNASTASKPKEIMNGADELEDINTADKQTEQHSIIVQDQKGLSEYPAKHIESRSTHPLEKPENPETGSFSNMRSSSCDSDKNIDNVTNAVSVVNEVEMEKQSNVQNEKILSLTDDTDGVVCPSQVGKGCFDLLDGDMELLLESQKSHKDALNVNSDSKGVKNIETEEMKSSFCERGNSRSEVIVLENKIQSENINETVKEKGSVQNINGNVTEKGSVQTVLEKGSVQNINGTVTEKGSVQTINGTITEKGSIQKSDIVDWSKGLSMKQTDGQEFEPVKLLVPGQTGNKRPPSPTLDQEIEALTPPSKKRQPNVQVDQPRIYECAVKSDSDKYRTGFVAFSKQVRPKVVQEHPSADYDTVTKIVQEKWASLSDTNKQHFCMVGKEEIQILKKTVVEKKKLSQKITPRPTAQVKSGVPSIKDQLLASNKSRTVNKTPLKSMTARFSLKNLKQVYNTGIRESQSQMTPDLILIGPLRFYNAWVCCCGSQILLLNPHRVEETLLYRELLEKHVLQTTALENPVRLTESNTGGPELYQTLLTLFPSETGNQIYTTAEDKRLVANGIQVRRHFNQDGSGVLDMVGLSMAMPLYGLTDLIEILDLVCHTGATNLSKSRPLKVINYLQSEAVRMIRQRPLQRTREDMLDLVDQIKTSLSDKMVNCLHNKPFLHEIFDIKTTSILSC